MDIRDEIRANRQIVKEQFTQDVLGVRGTKWDGSVHMFPGKNSCITSDRALTNTLTTSHITANDLRTIMGTKHVRADKVAATYMSRNQHTGTWNASTYFERAEVIKRAEDITAKSVKATQSVRSELLVNGYITPVQRSAAVNLRIRETKAGGDEQELEQLYGADGAQAMRDTMKLPTYGRAPPRHHRSRTTPEDLAAVEALPEHINTSRPSGSPASREASQPSEAMELGGTTLANEGSITSQAA